MNYQDFLDSLSENGYQVDGKSVATKIHNDWLLAYIGIGGRNQKKGKNAYILCARPIDIPYMDAPKKSYSTNPFEYPYKFTEHSFDPTLTYKSQLLRIDHSYINIEGEWSGLFQILSSNLPIAVDKLGKAGLLKQLNELKEPGYAENIWSGKIKCLTNDCNGQD